MPMPNSPPPPIQAKTEPSFPSFTTTHHWERGRLSKQPKVTIWSSPGWTSLVGQLQQFARAPFTTHLMRGVGWLEQGAEVVSRALTCTWHFLEEQIYLYIYRISHGMLWGWRKSMAWGMIWTKFSFFWQCSSTTKINIRQVAQMQDKKWHDLLYSLRNP